MPDIAGIHPVAQLAVNNQPDKKSQQYGFKQGRKVN
jgi:hypothetical protein